MQRGRLNKARRGAHGNPVPIGYAYDPMTGRLELSPDQGVRHAVEQIVHLFAQLGWMSSVVLWLNREGQQLPHQIIVVVSARKSSGGGPASHASSWAYRLKP